MKVNQGRIELISVQFFLCCLLALLTVFCCLAQQTAIGENAQKPPRRERFRMENGLTVILLENHKQNKVVVVSFYRAGFMHEPRGKAHISHLAEHMVLRCATRSYKPNESLMLLQKKGMANAETLATFVYYDYLLPSSDLELALRIESERLTSVKFSEKILKEEIPKCLREIEFVQINPQAGLIKFGLVGLSQAIRFGEKFVPVYAGTYKLTLEDVQQFHKEHYRPESALLVIVGDFESEAAKTVVRKYFANIPKGGREPRPVVQMSKDIRANWDLGSDALYLVYPGAADDFDERITLTLFGNYLLGRLFVDEDLKKVTKTSFCSNQLYPVGELPFFIFAEAKQGEALERVREALKKVVEKALREFNAQTFSQTKLGLLSFMRSSLLEGGLVPPHIKYERLLGQEAINLGIKELLRGGISEEEFLRRVNALDFQAANKIIKMRLSEENEKEVLFITTKEEGRCMRKLSADRFVRVVSRMVEAINAEDYVGIQRDFSKGMRDAFPFEKSTPFFKNLRAQYGKIESLDPPRLIPPKQAIFLAHFERAVWNIKVILDSEDKMIGLLFLPPTPSIAVPDKHETKLSLPFKGEWLVFWGGDTRELNIHHYVPFQRFAFDFLGVDEKGKTHKGDGKANEDYYAFGREVLAPAEGTITDVIRGVRDNALPGSMNPYSPLGNAVFISHREHEVSVLVHLKLGSIKVKVGDTVKRGQVIALCGNSGKSTEPHLHYNLQNTPIIQDATGIKCYFQKVIVTKDGKKEVKINYSPIKGEIVSPG